ncbi:MAG: endonuclease/exonuclease/phosphatase family protein [Microthrixaceae bacterium]
MPTESVTTRSARRLLLVATIIVATALTACGGGGSGRGGPDSDVTTTSAVAPRWDGRIHALTYNVAGLPEALSGSNPETNTQLIGPRLNDFDLVLLQETWKTPEPNPLAPIRVYYEILQAQSTHKFASPMLPQPLGSNPERTSALLADGLALFSNIPMGDVTHTAWTGCFGGMDTSDHGAADCLATKGFAVTTITVADGVTIDVYDLHAEAGSSSKDQELQAADYRQLADYIDTHSKDHAIILGGDTNLHIEADPKNPQDTADDHLVDLPGRHRAHRFMRAEAL